MLILVVDDEVKVRTVICQYLKNAGYETIEATNGVSAMEVINKYSIDLAIIDIMLPRKNGLETCKEIKNMRKSCPVILLSALSSEEDRLNGFEAYADDYVVKPFSPKELVARVNVILRRNITQYLRYYGIVVDVKKRIVLVDNNEVSMNKKEFVLLELFLHNVGVVLTREEIIKNVWGYANKVDRTIDTHIKMIRAKMGKYGSYLVTIRGVGYKLNA